MKRSTNKKTALLGLMGMAGAIGIMLWSSNRLDTGSVHNSPDKAIELTTEAGGEKATVDDKTTNFTHDSNFLEGSFIEQTPQVKSDRADGVIEIERLAFDRYNYDPSDVREFRKLEEGLIEGILENNTGEDIYFRAKQSTAGEWLIAESSILGEFVVLNEFLPTDQWDQMGYLRSGTVQIIDQNDMFSRVRVPVKDLRQQESANLLLAASLPSSAYEPNAVVYPVAVPNDPGYAGSWTLQKLDLEPVWERYGFSPEAALGRRPIIAVVDNGAPESNDYHIWINVDEIPGNGIDDDKNGFIDDVTGYNFWDDNGDMSYTGGHGSNVARIAASLTNNGIGNASPASSASLMRVNFYEDVNGSHYDALDAMLYAIKNGADVVNCSWVSSSGSMLNYVFDLARSKKVVVVAAAGNNGKDLGVSPQYPAYSDDPCVLSVGASGSDDTKASSNWSPTRVDVFAPGSVTSYSTPLATSAVALLKALKPDATHEALISAVISGADYIPALDGLCVSNGRLNVRGAVEALLGVDLSAPGSDPVPPPPPVAPSVSVSNIGETSLKLSWSTRESVDSFEGQYSEAGGAWTALEPSAMFAGNTTGSLIEGLLPDTSYRFRIRAVSGGQSSDWTVSATVSTLPVYVPPPVAPSVSVSDIGETSLKLSWSTRESVDSFEVQYSEAGGAWSALDSFAGNSTGSLIEGLHSDTSYRFRIRAVSGGQSSEWTVSATVSTLPVYVPPPPPVAPSVSISDIGETSLQLSWSTSEMVDSFEVQYSEAGGVWRAFDIFAGNSTGSLIEGLLSDTSYSFRIRAVSGGQSSEWTVSATVSTLPAYVPPSTLAAPGVSVSDIGETSLKLSWSTSETVDGFEVRFSEDGNRYVPLEPDAIFPANSSGILLEGLLANTQYLFRVRTFVGDQISDWTITDKIFTLPAYVPPPPPVAPSVSVSDIGETSLQLSWSTSEIVESFEVQYSEAGGVWSAFDIFAGDSTGSLIEGLLSDTSYSFRIRAVSGGQSSEWTVSATVSTLPAYVPPSTLAAPGVSVSDIGETSLKLSWSTSETVDGFEVRFSEDGNRYVPLEPDAIFPANSSGILLEGLLANTQYLFRVRTFVGDQISDWTITDKIFTLPAYVPPPPPVAPSVSVSDIGETSLQLSWSTSESVESFEVQYSEAGGAWSALEPSAMFAGDTTGSLIEGLLSDTSYSFRIRAVSGGQPSDWAVSAPVSTLPAYVAPLTAPESVSSELNIDGSISLTWSDVSDRDGYEIEVSETGNSYQPLSQDIVYPAGNSGTGVVIDGLAGKASYSFRIRSVRDGQVSAWAESNAVYLPGTPSQAVDLLPTHYWDFESEADFVAYDFGLVPRDATYENLFRVTGVDGTGYGLLFSGSHDGLKLPDCGTLNNAIIDQLTISFWYRMDAAQAGKSSIIYDQGGFWRGLNIVVENGWLYASGWNRPQKESDWQGTTLLGGRLPVGEWVHITLVLDAGEIITENGLKLYINGQLLDAGPASQLWEQSDDNGVGQVQKSTSIDDRQARKMDPLQGTIDDFAIWNAALNEQEIQSLFLRL